MATPKRTRKSPGGKKKWKRAVEPPKRKGRVLKRKQWSEESMLGAIKAVQEGTLGVNRAALEFAVPKTTLKDRLSGRVIHGSSCGARPYLSKEEEKELVNFITTCSKMGYGKTRKEVLALVEAAIEKKGRELKNPISNGWWTRFQERWPNLRLRRGDPFSVARDKMTDRAIFENYFSLLRETLEEHGLKNRPGQIYNCDESGMPLEHTPPKTIAIKGTKKVRQITCGNKTQISILACGNAFGEVIPPMVIFSGKRFNFELSKGEVPGTIYGMSDSGWMDTELFYTWFANQFLKYASKERPLLLLLDGHSSHFTLQLVQLARENDVHIFCLPPHTTADSQPLDTSCFGPLKKHWAVSCHRYLSLHPGRVITKFQFSTLFSEAWEKGMSVSNIMSGFRCTGVCPFDPEAILKKLPSSDSPSTQDLSQLSSLSSSYPNSDPVEQMIPEETPADSNSAWAFSDEEIELYKQRLDNGYDIFTDQRYVAWLRKFHPELGSSLKDSFSSFHSGILLVIILIANTN